MRQDGRLPNGIRKVTITPGFNKYAEGSCLIEVGNTKVICTASVESGVPPFLRGKGTGWITAEYGMIPRSTHTRLQRESSKGSKGGRTQEIQRLLGRAARCVSDMTRLGERTIWLDCDVIQADGGTRCAGITGSFVALVLALKNMLDGGLIDSIPVSGCVAAVSVGMIGGKPCLDLTYDEDSSADVDMNVVMTDSGEFVEVQGTAEKAPFSGSDLASMLELAEKGVERMIKEQKSVLKGIIK